MRFNSKTKTKGFTTAEVLMTIAIIGVVAVMTIPVMINNAQGMVQLALFKKAYNTISQAWTLAVMDRENPYTQRGGWTCTWADGTTTDYNANDGRIDSLTAKMNVVKTCVNQTGCWPNSYEPDPAGQILGNSTVVGGWCNPYNYSWTTSNGMCWSAPWKGIDEVHVLVDTNCNSAPNKIGQDIFSFLLGADGTVYFAIDNVATAGKPVSSGLVCPYYANPATINGRSISFTGMLN